MGLDLWFRDDVVRILASAHETMRSSTMVASPAGSKVVDAYQQGFLDALRAVGIAFGVVAPGVSGQTWPARGVQIVDVEDLSIQRNRRQRS